MENNEKKLIKLREIQFKSVLATIYMENGKTTNKRIAKLTGLTIPSVSRALTQLEMSRMINITRDPNDSRHNIIELKMSGKIQAIFIIGMSGLVPLDDEVISVMMKLNDVVRNRLEKKVIE